MKSLPIHDPARTTISAEQERRMSHTPPINTGIAPTDGFSHVKGDTDTPLSEDTIFGLLAQTAAQHPNRSAVVFREQGVRWSWRQFEAEVVALAGGLEALGLRRGDRLGMWSPNRALVRTWAWKSSATSSVVSVV